MAVFGADGWFGSIFFRSASYKAKLTGGDDPGQRHDEQARPLTPDVAMQLGTVWSCVRLLSETIGTLPLGVYRKDAQGKRTADSAHGLYGLIHDSPNADMTAAEFWEAAVANLCLWGNFYAEKVIGAGGLQSLNFLYPDLMVVKRDRYGARVYVYSDPKGRREYREDEIFHVRGFGAGGDVGLSPISYARKTLGLAIDTDMAATSAFRTGTRPSGWLIVPKGSTKDQKRELRETFLDPVTGARSTSRAGILEQGMDWKNFEGMPAEDLQLLQGRAFNVEELCRWFRVPPFMVGHTEKTTSWGTGLEQQMIGFLTFSLRPYLTRIEQAIKKQLIDVKERASVYVEFNLEGLLRADSAGRAAIMSVQAQNGLKTRNELRAKENDPPLPGGDVLTVQSNLLPLDQLGQNAGAGDQQARTALLGWLGLDQLIEQAVKARIGHNGGLHWSRINEPQASDVEGARLRPSGEGSRR
ncbi:MULTISPECIES: phage portal protein [unclassified Mesorhizobium]|uniref:phage portal protein n=1 Tax=unclassified Mesorhizobium TaxID=325217 RepID=UPI00248474BE|nr:MULTISPECIES: phage portal protein [unclassified Mesorhizobium]